VQVRVRVQALLQVQEPVQQLRERPERRRSQELP
jgi:hypothetical protein